MLFKTGFQNWNPSGSTNTQSQCCLLNGAKRQSRSSGICLHEFSNGSECPKRQHLACGCSQHLPGHPRPSHVLSLTLWLPVNRMRRQCLIRLFWSFPMTGSGTARSRAGPTREGLPHQQPAWGHFTTFFLLLLTQTSKHTGPAAVTTALYGPGCLSLCNGHSCAHVLETGLGCCDDVLNTAWSRRRRTTCVCCTQQQKSTQKKCLTRCHLILSKRQAAL